MIKLLTRPLPDEVKILIRIVFLLAVAAAVRQLWSLPPNLPAGVTHRTCVIALLFVIVSLVLALFSHHVPQSIRKNTSLAAVFFWWGIALSFGIGAIFYLSQLSFGISISAAAFSLLLLATFLYSQTISMTLAHHAPDGIDVDGARLVAKVGLVIVAALGPITVIVTPILGYFSPSILPVHITGSILHVALFSAWTLTAWIVALFDE